jgi:hypothetical protein
MVNAQAGLEAFLNHLKVVLIVPNITKTTLALIPEVTRKVDFLLII